MLNWTEEQLTKALEKNPALRINERYSMPAKPKKKNVGPRAPKLSAAPLKYYDIELPIRIHLAHVPPSLNEILRMNPWVRAKEEEEFRNAVRWDLKVQNVKAFRSPVDLLIVIYFPQMRHRDRDNYLKWTKDALKGIVFIDDDPRYIASEDVEFKKGKKRMEVIIHPRNG